MKKMMETTRTIGMMMIETNARRRFIRAMAANEMIKIITIRPTPIAWSAKNRRKVSTSEVARSSRSPVFDSE